MIEELKAFIARDLIRDPRYPLKNDEPLISGGLIDSLSLVQLQIFIEQQFGIHIEDTELTTDNVDTVNDLMELINERGGDTRPV